MIDHSSVPDCFSLIPLIFLYAEIHYCIPGLPSRLFQRLPELIADAPIRLQPQQPLPILLLVKDADVYPITLERVWVAVRQQEHQLFSIELLTTSEWIQTPWWERIFFLELPNSIRGKIALDVFIQIKKHKKTTVFCNDNYRGTSHSALQVLVAEERLPHFADQYFGDLHFHSNYTSDQVEFGASLRTTQAMAQAVGLSYFAATDHSYDLDDEPNNYLRNDHRLTKWHRLQEEIQTLNGDAGQHPVWILAGEEATARNRFGLNVHFLILNSAKFYFGSGDGAEHSLQTRTEWSINEILNDLEDASLALAAHPFALPMRLENLLLRRDCWRREDVQHPRLNGLQILNGFANQAFLRGLQHWRRLLLNGNRLFIYAGNDAHGNFNRYRQVKLPFWNMLEHDHYVFGKMRTGVMVTENFSPSALLSALRAGQCYITDGPALDFCALRPGQAAVLPGGQVTSAWCNFHVAALSTSEFGSIRRVDIFYGDLQQRREQLFRTYQPANQYRFETDWQFTIQAPGYFRVEAETETSTTKFHAYSNPLWVEMVNAKETIHT